jgi:predicted CXXCH cytochrome family protein
VRCASPAIISRAAALALLLAAAAAPAGSIMGSAHDFTRHAWSGGQVCVTCHDSRNANSGVAAAPMWNHALPTRSYTLYSSATMKASLGQPGQVSRLCLSCHDGTVAVDSYGGKAGTQYISPVNHLGTVLGDDHPIGFIYDSALAAANGSLFDPALKVVTIGSGAHTQTGVIGELLLYNGQLECTSCHDVHNAFTVGNTRLLKMDLDRSVICTACHNK